MTFKIVWQIHGRGHIDDDLDEKIDNVEERLESLEKADDYLQKAYEGKNSAGCKLIKLI